MSKERRYLSGRFFVVLSLWLLIGVVSIIYPLLFGVYIGLLPLIAIVTLSDRSSLPTRYSFSGLISGGNSVELGADSEFSIELRPTSRVYGMSRKLFVSLPSMDEFVVDEGNIALLIETLDGSIRLSGKIRFRPRRLGFVEIKRIRVTGESLLGLWYGEREIEISPHKFRIVPHRRRVPEARFREIVSHQRLLYQGTRLLTRSITSDQYYTSREYRYPDPMKSIDHRKSAKFGTLLTRVYDALHQQHLVILLDLGRGLCGEISGSAKHDYYLSAALALTEHALKAGDQVSLVAFSDRVHISVSRSRTIQAFQPIFRGGEALKAREVATNYSLIDPILSEIAPQRSVVVVLSDCSLPSVQDALSRQLQNACRKHVLLVVGLLSRDYELSEEVERASHREFNNDSYARLLYCYWVNEGFDLFAQRLSRAGGGAVSIPEDYWMSVCARLYERLRLSMGT